MKTALTRVPDQEPDRGSVSFWAFRIHIRIYLYGSRNTGTVLTRTVFGPAEALLLGSPNALELIGTWVYLNLHTGGSISITNLQLVKPTGRKDRTDSSRTKGTLNLTIGRAMECAIGLVEFNKLGTIV
jgi:hypothetical protein